MENETTIERNSINPFDGTHTKIYASLFKSNLHINSWMNGADALTNTHCTVILLFVHGSHILILMILMMNESERKKIDCEFLIPLPYGKIVKKGIRSD